MNISLFHKNALVCGGSKGIGRAVAYELAELGANVTILSRSQAAMEAVVNDLPNTGEQDHSFVVADLMNTDSLNDIMAELVKNHKIHILVNNTGGPAAGTLLDAKPEALTSGFMMHVIASQIMAKHVVPTMKEEGYGRILNVISTSVKEIIPGLGVSNTIRGAMGNWSKTMATELAPFGITVNNILPGFTATSRLDAIIQNKMKAANKSEDEMVSLMKSYVPMKRFADPSEVAQVLAFLASPAASYVTGINLPVDGGRTKSL